MQTYQSKLWMTPWGDGTVYQSWRLEQVSEYKQDAMKHTADTGLADCLTELDCQSTQPMLLAHASGPELSAWNCICSSSQWYDCQVPQLCTAVLQQVCNTIAFSVCMVIVVS